MARWISFYCKDCGKMIRTNSTQERRDNIREWTWLQANCPDCGRLLRVRVR